jgi:predicted ATPase
MIRQIDISNFMAFTQFRAETVAPINLIIGKNDTGKSALLKLLYSACQSIDSFSRQRDYKDLSFRRVLSDKLIDTFEPGRSGLGELVSKHTRGGLRVELGFNHPALHYQADLSSSFPESTGSEISDLSFTGNPISDKFRCLFIPPKEVLSPFKAIRATRDNLKIPGFDDTYLDLIRALVVPATTDRHNSNLSAVNEQLEALFAGRIEQRNDDDFVFRKGNAEYPISMTAEGVKKIGILTTLINNGQLNATSVLFLDEPETTLHPGATRVLVEMLVMMAQAGVQIFMASHNYFVLKQLHIAARKYQIDIGCYSLNRRSRNESVRADYINLREGLLENAIIDESLKMYDEDIRTELGL